MIALYNSSKLTEQYVSNPNIVHFLNPTARKRVFVRGGGEGDIKTFAVFVNSCMRQIAAAKQYFIKRPLNQMNPSYIRKKSRG